MSRALLTLLRRASYNIHVGIDIKACVVCLFDARFASLFVEVLKQPPTRKIHLSEATLH